MFVKRCCTFAGIILKKTFFAIGILIILSCSESSEKKELSPEEITRRDSLEAVRLDSLHRADTMKMFSDRFPEINYKNVKIEDWRHLAELKKKYRNSKNSERPFKALETLNREEIRYFNKGETIVIPDTVVDDMRAYSVFPQFYWEARHIPKIVIVSNKYQAYGCYEHGELVRFAAVNSGKERTPTYPGRYALVWKEEKHRSSLDSNWVMPYTWNFHAQAGNAFHQFAMPGYPASHSCVRQLYDDARWLYYWGEGRKLDSNRKPIPLSGTPVILIDIYDFSRKMGPWNDLATNEPVIELPDNPMEIEEALIPYCQIPDGAKGSLRNRDRFIHAEDTLRARGIIRPHVRLIETFNYNDHRRKQAKLAEKKKKEEEAKKRPPIIETTPELTIEKLQKEENNKIIMRQPLPEPVQPIPDNSSNENGAEENK